MRKTPTLAALLLATMAIGAGPLFNIGLCYNSNQNWFLNARGLADHSAVVSLSVDLHCNQVPRATNPCVWCAGYVVEGWAGPINGWVRIRDESHHPASVGCDSATTTSIMTTFNGTIFPGQYRARGWLWDGTCDDEIEEEEYQVVAFTVPQP